MKDIKEFLYEAVNREPNSGEKFYNTDKPNWSKDIQKRIKSAVKKLQKPIKANDIPIGYLSTGFYTKRSKEWVTSISCDKFGILLNTSDSKIQVYIPFDGITEKLKYWIEDENEVIKILNYIETF